MPDGNAGTCRPASHGAALGSRATLALDPTRRGLGLGWESPLALTRMSRAIRVKCPRALAQLELGASARRTSAALRLRPSRRATLPPHRSCGRGWSCGGGGGPLEVRLLRPCGSTRCWPQTGVTGPGEAQWQAQLRAQGRRNSLRRGEGRGRAILRRWTQRSRARAATRADSESARGLGRVADQHGAGPRRAATFPRPPGPPLSSGRAQPRPRTRTPGSVTARGGERGR